MAYFYAFSFRSSEWVTLVCDLHSYRAYSVLYCEIKHCRSTIIYKCIYLHVYYYSIFTCIIMFHVYLTLDCTQWDKVDYSERYRIACRMLINRIYRLWRTKAEEQPLYVLASLLLSLSHTHTHTHTEREREKPAVESLSHRVCLKTTTSHVFPDPFQKWVWIDVLSAAQMGVDRRKIIVMTQLLRGHSFSC